VVGQLDKLLGYKIPAELDFIPDIFLLIGDAASVY
jgi:hypothetical protein